MNATGGFYGAGIGGGGFGVNGGTITIQGGTVNATNDDGMGAGIGGGYDGDGGDIEISGGTVTAISSDWGAGIGGGARSGPSGGSGGTITIQGGTVTATSDKGAAIGGGAGSGGDNGGSGGTITIEGGTVNATSGYGAGIGGGFGVNGGAGGNITIQGGTITATGGNKGAGIGGAENGAGGDITIQGGAITANGGNSGAGIGGGLFGGGGNITIQGGTITATGGNKGAGIGGGGNNVDSGGSNAGGIVSISGGVVRAAAGGGSLTQDIGRGHGADSDGSLSISDTAAVFLKTNTCTDPVTTVTHTHETITGHTAGDDVCGIPMDWAGGFGAYLRLFTLSYDANGGAGAPAPVTQHTGTTATVADDSGLTRTGHIFSRWDTAADGSGTAYAANDTFTFDADTTLYAQWTDQPASGGGRSKSRTPSEPDYSASVPGGNPLPISVNEDTGSASVQAGTDLGSALLGGENVLLTIPSIPGVSSYTLGIPTDYLSASGGGTLTFSTDTGSLTLPADMLSGMAGEGSQAEITIGSGDKYGLSAEAGELIGDRPLIEISITIDGNPVEWNNPAAPVTISIPYAPTDEELLNPESMVVWYIDGRGNPVCVPNGRYDPATGAVTFAVTHFSLYGVGYNEVNFRDVAKGAWYSKAVSFITARGIASGTGGGNFSPDARLTRGQFIVMLMRAYGLTPDINPTDNFFDAGDTWYTGYLAAAKEMGISNGVDGNLFAPSREITRQEMFTLLYNALKVMGQLPQDSSGKTLSGFTDAVEISPWAKDAMSLLVQTGTISGSGSKITPAGTATRAEMAQVLYALLSK